MCGGIVTRKIGFVPHFFYDVTESKGFLTPEKRMRNEILHMVGSSGDRSRDSAGGIYNYTLSQSVYRQGPFIYKAW